MKELNLSITRGAPTTSVESKELRGDWVAGQVKCSHAMESAWAVL